MKFKPYPKKPRMQGDTEDRTKDQESMLYQKQDLPGMRHSSAAMKEFLTDVSTGFRDKISGRTGKGERGNSPDSPNYRKNKPFRKKN